MNAQGTMRIGEVHAILRRDVPDIELSKIRYYEDKGLVRPTRSRKGYRLYSQRDVECLREAIRLANEEFVPLRVVRLRLIEQGLLDDERTQPSNFQVARASSASVISMPAPSESPSPGRGDVTDLTTNDDDDASPVLSIVSSEPSPFGVDEQEPTPEVEAVLSAPGSVDEPSTFLTTVEFLDASGLDAPTMNQLLASGLLRPRVIAQQSAFDELDLRVAHSAGALLARGVDVRFLGSLRRNVEREIGLLNDVTQPIRVPQRGLSVDQARDTAQAVGVELEALRADLFARALQEYLGV